MTVEKSTVTNPDPKEKSAKVYRFDLFKGGANAAGKIEKVCSVGHAIVFEGSTTYSVFLKTLVKDQFYLLPEQEPSRACDYVILSREPSTVLGKKYFWNRVGTAKNLSGQNAGILKLEFDLFTGLELYMNFHEVTVKEQDVRLNPSA